MFEKLFETIKNFFKTQKIELNEEQEKTLKSDIEKIIKDSGGNLADIDLSKLDLSKIASASKDDDGISDLVKALIQKNTALETKFDSAMTKLSEMYDNEKKRMEAIEAEAKSKKEKDVKDAVDEAIKSKKFTDADKDTLTKLAEKDLENFKAMVKSKIADKHFNDERSGRGDDKDKDEVKSPLDFGGGILSKVKEYSGNGSD